MPFFASWWERVPVRQMALSVVTLLAVGGPVHHVVVHLLRLFSQPSGNYWG